MEQGGLCKHCRCPMIRDMRNAGEMGVTIDRVDDQLHHWQSNCHLSCCYCNTRRIHTGDDHGWQPTRRRDMCVGDGAKPAVVTFDHVYTAMREMLLEAYKTYQIGL